MGMESFGAPSQTPQEESMDLKNAKTEVLEPFSNQQKEGIHNAFTEKTREHVRSILTEAKETAKAMREANAQIHGVDEKAATNELLQEYYAIKRLSEGMSGEGTEGIQERLEEIRQDPSVSEVIQRREAAEGPAQTEWEKKHYPRVTNQ